MSTTTIYTKYRPMRIGFLVRDKNINDLIQAARINSFLWGGACNPIIPLKKDHYLSDNLVNLFEVDELYAVSSTPNVKKILEKYNHIHSYGKDGYLIFDYPSILGKNELKILDVINLLKLIWDFEKEEKFRKRLGKGPFHYFKWDQTDNLSNLFTLLFGEYNYDNEIDNQFKSVFNEGYKSTEFYIKKEDELPDYSKTWLSPIFVTTLKIFKEFNFHKHNGVFIGNPNKFDDLLCYWNLRATGIEIGFFPIGCEDRFKNHISTCRKFLKETIPQFKEYFYTIYSYNRNSDIMKKYIKRYFKEDEDKVYLHNVSEISWNGLKIKSCKLYFQSQSDTVNASTDKSKSKFRITFSLPEKDFLSKTRDYSLSQSLAIDVKASSNFETPFYTLTPPNLPHLNEYFSRNIHYDHSKLRLNSNGISILCEASESILSLNPMSFLDVIIKVFEFFGLKVKLSQPGRIALNIINKFGDLEGCRVFKIKGVRKLLEKMDINESTTFSNATNIIFDNESIKRFERLVIEEGQSLPLNKDFIFTYLLKYDFFKAGIELICNDCNIKNWYSLKELSDNNDCIYCGNTLKTSLQLKKRGDWKFRKSGLFSKENNQEGSIPVLLTLLQINGILDFGIGAIYSTSLELNADNIVCEIDFCILSYSVEGILKGNLEVGIGEAKSSGGEINENDISNLILVQNKIISKGINCYIIFSKTADCFNSEEINLIKNTKFANKPIIFTNKELEPYFPFEDYPKDHGKYVHASTFSEIAELTYNLHILSSVKN